MKKNLFSRVLVVSAVMVLLASVSCRKEKLPGQDIPVELHPEMEYFELGGREIKADGSPFLIDVNHDGRNDLALATMLVGDPVNQVDKLRFLVMSNIEVNLPVNAAEEIPVMNAGDLIVPGDFNGYHWFEVSTITLVQKIIPLHAPVSWEGNWKNAVNKYLPYQVLENGKRYNGWIKLSVDITGEKIILHKAAISKEPGKTVRAGV